MGTLTLEHVAMQSRPYPVEELKDCETGLVLFAAAFNGWNDAVHFAEAGLRTTCVDIDGPKLRRMQMLYPAAWGFHLGDAWAFADMAYARGEQWDAVSCDTFQGDATRKSLDSLDLWCSLARKVVTVTLSAGQMYRVPKGWVSELYERAPGVYWLVLTRG